VPDATFARPDLTTFARLDELGLEVVGQRVEPDRAVLACRVVEPEGSDERWCRRCGCEGSARDTVRRRLAHEPLGWRPTVLLITVRRYRCGGCGHVWRQDTSRAAEARAKLSRRGLRWALEGIVCQHLTIARVAEGLGVSWNTANDAVLAEGRRALIEDPSRFDGVRVIGVDEHVWRHTRPGDQGDKYVTVIIDLTPVRDGTGPARLLDMVEGRSKSTFQEWLAERPAAWRDGVEVVAMDGFTGFKTAAAEELPDATAVMDPFHVVRLAGDALDRCRRRVQQHLHGHRGRKDDPLYAARRTLHTGADLLTDKQRQRLTRLFDAEEHVEVEATWGIYQRMITAYRDPDRSRGRTSMQRLINSVSSGVPAALTELTTLGRTLKRRAADVLAYFDRPGTSNGPTEAINGRLEHLRGSALGFRNLTNYIARCLLETGGFKSRLHPASCRAGLAPPPRRATLEGRESSIAHAARATPANVCGRALVRDRRRLDAGGSAAGPSRRAMPAGRRRCCGHGVRVQSAATAAGRADRRPLLLGGCAAVRPADAAADAVGAAHRQPRFAVPHPRRHRRRDGRVRRRLHGHHAHPRVGVRLPTPDPVRRRALQAVGAGAVPADARGRAV
jgi:transposase